MNALAPQPQTDRLLAAQIAPGTHDERARQGFVSALRRHVMVKMSAAMRASYERELRPQFERTHARPPADGVEVRRLMRPHPIYQAWSALRYNAQEMTWASVQPQIERHLPALRKEAERAQQAAPSLLRLKPDTKLPSYYTALDIHLMPGNFHSEFGDQDVAQGAVYELGTAVFGGGMMLRRRGAVGLSMAHYLRIAHPQFVPQRILDLGCTVGNNTLPYVEVFPDAEVHGIDLSAPQLRFAHARAQACGATVHYSQQNAEQTDFPDGHFDLIVSSFFLHEISTASTRKVFREAWRLLRPGGLMLHMELPPASEADPYYNFYLDWDAYHNNEPHYAEFRRQDFAALCSEAGFEERNFVQRRIGNYTAADPEEFAEIARGERDAPAHGNGASWFVFGAWK
ncbi:MAG: class I SAM-dependent methyltransferase [Gammaproteobacteria bacterium]|nr:class I SAM-dependent methyltransferase [Gammaproteobacteria bacterium]